MNPHRWLIPVPVAVLLLVLGGCDRSAATTTAAAPIATTAPVTTTTPTLDWLLVGEETEPYGMTALLEGTLEIDATGRCITVVEHPLLPLVFKAGTHMLDTDPPVIVLPDGRALHGGDRLSLTGGAIPAENLARIDSLSGLDVPDPCWPTDPENQDLWVIAPGPEAVEILEVQDWLPVVPDGVTIDAVDRLEGELLIDPSRRCVTVDGIPIVAPPGSFVEIGTSPRLWLPNFGASNPPGSIVAFDGMLVPLPGLPILGPTDIDIPDPCVPTGTTDPGVFVMAP